MNREVNEIILSCYSVLFDLKKKKSYFV